MFREHPEGLAYASQRTVLAILEDYIETINAFIEAVILHYVRMLQLSDQTRDIDVVCAHIQVLE